MASGVPIEAFAREIGMPLKDLTWLAGHKSRKLEGEASEMWTRLMGLLNRKLGEIMNVRIDIERREAKARARKVAARAQVGRRRGR